MTRIPIPHLANVETFNSLDFYLDDLDLSYSWFVDLVNYEDPSLWGYAWTIRSAWNRRYVLLKTLFNSENVNLKVFLATARDYFQGWAGSRIRAFTSLDLRFFREI